MINFLISSLSTCDDDDHNNNNNNNNNSGSYYAFCLLLNAYTKMSKMFLLSLNGTNVKFTRNYLYLSEISAMPCHAKREGSWRRNTMVFATYLPHLLLRFALTSKSNHNYNLSIYK